MTTETRTEAKPASSRTCRQCGMVPAKGRLYYAIQPDVERPRWVCLRCLRSWERIRGYAALGKRKEAGRE